MKSGVWRRRFWQPVMFPVSLGNVVEALAVLTRFIITRMEMKAQIVGHLARISCAIECLERVGWNWVY